MWLGISSLENPLEIPSLSKCCKGWVVSCCRCCVRTWTWPPCARLLSCAAGLRCWGWGLWALLSVLCKVQLSLWWEHELQWLAWWPTFYIHLLPLQLWEYWVLFKGRFESELRYSFRFSVASCLVSFLCVGCTNTWRCRRVSGVMRTKPEW